MKRTLSLAALMSAAFALPVLAADAPAVDANASKTEGAALSVAANAEQARKILQSKGYTNVSDMARENGRWTGTAVKDGKTIFVAVDLPAPQPAASTN